MEDWGNVEACASRTYLRIEELQPDNILPEQIVQMELCVCDAGTQPCCSA